jgi:hypothetical protein
VGPGKGVATTAAGRRLKVDRRGANHGLLVSADPSP